MKNLSCMSYMGKGNGYVVVAGCQNVMLKIDIEKGRIVEEVYMTISRLLNTCLMSLDSYRA